MNLASHFVKNSAVKTQLETLNDKLKTLSGHKFKLKATLSIVPFEFVPQVFFQGESSECRVRVKALNELKGEQTNQQDQARLGQIEMAAAYQSEVDAEWDLHERKQQQEHEYAPRRDGHPKSGHIFSSQNTMPSNGFIPTRPKQNKWDKYLTPGDDY